MKFIDGRKLSWVLKTNSGRFLLFVLCLFLLDILFPLRIPKNYSPVVLDKKNNFLGAYLNNEDKWRMKCTLREVSPFFIKAIVEKEDKYFYYHFGLNPISIIRASFSNLKSKKRVSGASTITMQVIRLIYPNKRTYFNKLIEIVRAIQLELHYSKKQILETYINLVPYGSNLEGLKSASYIYLNKHPSKLSLAEAIILSIIPNRPSLLTKNKSELEKFKNKWLVFFKKKNIFTESEIAYAQNEKLHIERQEMQIKAPHFCNRLAANSEVGGNIFSTLNYDYQNQVENQINAYLKRVESIGLQNAMAMVIDNRTMEVLVYCGSSNYKNNFDGGQVDGITAIRSPGSTLKPYLYALSMEKGIINPKAVLYDIPTDFKGFTPVNFDLKYNGEVRMNDALQMSLNIPAVKTLDEYGLKEFIYNLKLAKFKNISLNEEKLGLSAILGGCGVSMEELIKLYAMFANGGKYQELQFIKNSQTKVEPKKLVSESSSFIISDILSGVQRPDFPNNFDFTFRLPKIAWKTGTSFGKRDAWAIGYNPNYTVGVWLGNFSGESITQLSGAAVATPLLFQIFNTIERKKTWFNMPRSIIYKEVCSVSGLPKNSFCKDTQMDYFIEGVFYKKKCSHLKKVWINRLETMSYCGFCVDKTSAIEKEYVNYPPEFISYLNSNGMGYQNIPPHNPDCTKISNQGKLKIISPSSDGRYFVELKNPQQIELRATSSIQSKFVLWYHNNKFLGKYPINTNLFIVPSIGRNKISCTDEFGKSVSVYFEATPI